MNVGALHDILNNNILPLLLATYTNPTIFQFRTVSKNHLNILSEYVYHLYNGSDLPISCRLGYLVLPQFDHRILELIKRERSDVTRGASIFHFCRVHEPEESVYYRAIICVSYDQSLTLDTKLALIEKEICTLDELFTNRERDLLYADSLFYKLRVISDNAITKLTPYIRSLMNEFGFIRNTELVLYILRRLDMTELAFDILDQRLTCLTSMKPKIIRNIHKLAVICVEIDQIRTLNILRLDELNSNMNTLGDDEYNKVWRSDGSIQEEIVNTNTRREFRLAFMNHVDKSFKFIGR